MSLTATQITELKLTLLSFHGKPPAPILERLAQEYGVTLTDLEAEIASRAETVALTLIPSRPAATILPRPDTSRMAKIPRNAALIQAILADAASYGQVARELNLSLPKLRMLLGGRLNPTEDEAAYLCQRFGLVLEETFVAASLPPLTGQIKGWSHLGILQAAKGLTRKALVAAVKAKSDVSIKGRLLSQIEQGKITELGQLSMQRNEPAQVEALAAFFDKKPEELLQRISQRQLDAFRSHVSSLHQVLSGAWAETHTPDLLQGETTGALAERNGGAS